MFEGFRTKDCAEGVVGKRKIVDGANDVQVVIIPGSVAKRRIDGDVPLS